MATEVTGLSDDRTMLARSGPLGVVAGGGRLPIEVASAAAAAGRTPHIVAIRGFAGPEIESFSHEWVSLGQVGGILASLRRAGCRDLVIAGALQRPNLWRLRFDLGALRRLPILLELTRGGDDSVLRRVVRFFEGEGFSVRGVGDVAPHLLASAGVMGAASPAPDQQAMIGEAAALISALGPFDVGQAVVAGDGGIVAVEGVRGTDALMRDIGPGGPGEGRGRGGVLVKLAKPGQEMRVDLPTIGPDTVEGASAAGLSGIAVGAGAAIVLERAVVIERADTAGLFVVGVDGRAAVEPPASGPVIQLPPLGRESTGPILGVLARRAPTPADRRDIAVGRRLLSVLRAHGGGRAAVIVREHVLAIAGALPIDRVVAGLGRNASWGRRALKGQIGVLALDIAGGRPGEIAPEALPDVKVFRAVVSAGLAGVVCYGGRIPQDRRADLVGWANEAKVFLMAEGPDDA